MINKIRNILGPQLECLKEVIEKEFKQDYHKKRLFFEQPVAFNFLVREGKQVVNSITIEIRAYIKNKEDKPFVFTINKLFTEAELDGFDKINMLQPVISKLLYQISFNIINYGS